MKLQRSAKHSQTKAKQVMVSQNIIIHAFDQAAIELPYLAFSSVLRPILSRLRQLQVYRR